MNTWSVSRDVKALDASIKYNFYLNSHLKTFTYAVLLYNYKHFPDLVCIVQIIPGCEHPRCSLTDCSTMVHWKCTLISFIYYFFFSVWWEVICCNAWSGRFERAISSRCAGPFLCGGARLFLFLYQHQPLKLKDSAAAAAAEAKWDFTPLCFLLFPPLFFFSPYNFCLRYFSLHHSVSHTPFLSLFFLPGNAGIKFVERPIKVHRCQ